MFLRNLFVYRYFNEVETQQQLVELTHNPFIRPLDIVFCKEDSNYYVLQEQLSEQESFEGNTPQKTLSFNLLSVGDQHIEKPLFFHAAQIGDTVSLKDNKTGVVIDIRYSLRLKDMTYIVQLPDESTVEILGSVVDTQLCGGKTALQSLMLRSDFSCI